MKPQSTSNFGFRSALAVFAFVAAFTWARAALAWPPSTHAFVGESKCEDCHDSSHEALKAQMVGPNGQTGADPVTVWNQDTHHKAFDDLTSDWGKTAAAKVKVADPQAAGSMCLGCHATGTGGNSPPDPSDQVSCEACHGAAADYVPKDKHGAIADNAANMAAAVGLGLIDVRKMDVREANCRGCHVVDTSKRPCYRASEKPFDVHNAKGFQHWRANVPVI
jgi:Cytochrome c554 and c-prime